MAKDLQGKTVAQLRALAREAGLRGFSRMTKSELLAALSEKKAVAPAKKSQPRRRVVRASGATRKEESVAVVEKAPVPSRPSSHESQVPVVTAPAYRDEDLGPLPQEYGEDRLAVVPRDPEWTFVHWEMSEETWRTRAAGVQAATLRVAFEDADGWRESSDSPVNPRQGRFYARVPRPGTFVSAEVGVVDEHGRFHALLRSDRLRTPRVGSRTGPVTFMTVAPDQPLRRQQGEDQSGVVGRLLSEEEYLRLFGRGVPGSPRGG